MANLICSSCGREFIASDASSASGSACPDCQKWGNQGSSPVPPKDTISLPRVCGICLSPVEAGAPTSSCTACNALYHEECWQENRGCAVYGCSQTPQVEQRSSVEIPVSFWGQENKPCPACGREILAAAIRCRFCGATFASAQPEDSSSFHQRAERDKRLPQLRQTVVWIFILSVIPCLAPIGGVWGLIWFATHRSDLEALPSLYPALCKIGIGVGLGQTMLLVLMTIIYSVTRGG
jgi:hypothetical protein